MSVPNHGGAQSAALGSERTVAIGSNVIIAHIIKEPFLESCIVALSKPITSMNSDLQPSGVTYLSSVRRSHRHR